MSVAKTLFTISVSVPEENEEGWGADMTTIITNLVDAIEATLVKDAGTDRFKVVLHRDAARQDLSASEQIESDVTFKRVSGDGGAVTADATTAIEAGETAGQLIVIVGNSDTNTVTINDGAGTAMAGNVTLGLNDTITLLWTGAIWAELARSLN